MGDKIHIQLEFTTHSCPTCGIYYALENSFRNRRKDAGEGWFCPNGHSVIFSKSTVTELKEQLEEKQASLNSLHNQILSKNLTIDNLQKEVKRKEIRAKAGVCPCCNRTFKELSNHMKSKHPEFTKPEMAIHRKINAK